MSRTPAEINQSLFEILADLRERTKVHRATIEKLIEGEVMGGESLSWCFV